MKHLVMIALVIGFVAVCGNAYSDSADHECGPFCVSDHPLDVESVNLDNAVSIGQQADQADHAEKMKQQMMKEDMCEAKLDNFFEFERVEDAPCRCIDECYEIDSDYSCNRLSTLCKAIKKPEHLVSNDGEGNYVLSKDKAKEEVELNEETKVYKQRYTDEADLRRKKYKEYIEDQIEYVKKQLEEAEKTIGGDDSIDGGPDFDTIFGGGSSEDEGICGIKLDAYFEGDAEELPCRCVDECMDECSDDDYLPQSPSYCPSICDVLERSCEIAENIDIQIKALQSSKERTPYVHADSPHNQIISERVNRYVVELNGVDENDDDAEDLERQRDAFFEGWKEQSGDFGEGFEETPFHSGDGDDDR